ncbi:hypothetical protein RVF87_18160 [Gordonia hydrophobica]|uniref:DoxX family protein n=2 Tax=Gordonia hydrophobica TaxID=40516 RepID=A0ABZ2UB97_9ACTN|nr:hypothetical protein [Gordonia hydrophobica]
MPSAANLRRAPVRIAAGAFILNSGIGKLALDDESAAGMQGMAAGAIPPVGMVSPGVFGKALAGAEIALGAALLAPIVPAAAAGAGLAAFSAGLLTMYVRTPGMHDGALRPTEQGIGIAKDSWLLGIAASLLIDAGLSGEGITTLIPRRSCSTDCDAVVDGAVEA